MRTIIIKGAFYSDKGGESVVIPLNKIKEAQLASLSHWVDKADPIILIIGDTSSQPLHMRISFF